MTEPKTLAEGWLERGGEEARISATCKECLRPIPLKTHHDLPTALKDCQCGHETTLEELLKAHGLLELLPIMEYSWVNENEP